MMSIRTGAPASGQSWHKGEGFSALRLLIVEPNRHMRVVLRGVLEALGIRDIHVAEDMAGGWEKFQVIRPDVVLCEMALGAVSGMDLVRMIRTNKDSHNPYVPVIMASAYSERHHVMAARDSGITEFLVKPFSAKRLFARLLAVCHDERNHVRSKDYAGPDRRRRADGPPGAERRKGGERRVRA